MADNDPGSSRPSSDDDFLADAIPIDPDALEDDSPDDADQGIELSAGADGPSKQIVSFARRQAHGQAWKRTPNTTGHGAIHVRTFVAKLRPDAIEHMDEQINRWLDEHPEYEVKFVSESVGTLQGKRSEPALFLSVWV